LVCSHLQLLDLISKDADTSDSSWSLILEDDANLHPKLNSTTAHDIVTRSLQKIDTMNPNNPAANGFVYFGMCRGDCKKISLDGILGSNCHGLCTHAYAVTKAAAKILPGLVYSHQLLNNSHIKIDSDQALLDYFENRGKEVHAHLIGHHLYYHESNQHIRGVIIQGKAKKKGFHGGTSLHSDSFVPMYCTHFNPSIPTTMHSFMHHPLFYHLHSFGLGDALFVYASLSALCVSKNTHPDFCLSSFIANPQHLSAVNQLKQALATHLPKQEFRCPIPQSNTTHNFVVMGFHAKAFIQPSGTIFSGRFHSYRYFEGSPAMKMIQERLRFSPKIDQINQEMFLSDEEAIAVMKSQESTVNARVIVVCVCTYKDTVANQSSYYWAAMNRFQRQYRSRSRIPLFLLFDEPPKVIQDDDMAASSNYFNNDSSLWVLSARRTDSNPNSNSNNSESQWLRRVSQCKQLILSGSSLSWWGAWAAGVEAHVLAPFAPTHFNLPRWTVL